jgi:hypothetical protein
MLQIGRSDKKWFSSLLQIAGPSAGYLLPPRACRAALIGYLSIPRFSKNVPIQKDSCNTGDTRHMQYRAPRRVT